MNKTFRSIWNAKNQAYVAAAETVSSQGKPSSGLQAAAVMSSLLGGLLGLSTLSLAAPPPSTLPTGGLVSAGSASISANGANLVVQQTTDRAAINWQTFNVGSNAQVQFNQPGASSVTLNRVLSTNPSQIFGRITANGQVILTNPSGVYFGPGSRVDVGGLVATTHSMGDADFMAGKSRFERGSSTGSVVNEGALVANLGGYIALLAPEVRNHGVVIAHMGTAALAAGEKIDLRFDRNNRLSSLRVTPSQIQALVDNQHAVQAPDGLVIISAQSIDQLAGGVVQNSGAIEATGLQSIGGRIVLSASQKVNNNGSLNAQSARSQGGSISLQGQHIELQPGTHIDVSGAMGGGTVLVGGNWQGSTDPLLLATEQSTQTAMTVTMHSGASIDARATDKGNGGTVVLWSDVSQSSSLTSVHGSIDARGGIHQGHGGMIETSGARLSTTGVTGSAVGGPGGAAGQWLFDPYDYTINSGEASTISGLLNGGTSVEISTANPTSHGISGSNATGHITVNSAIYATTLNAGLTLNAGTVGDVQINADISIAGPLTVYGNNINLNAGQSWSDGITTWRGGAAANILFKARGHIVQTSGGGTTANGGSIVYWSDSDGNGDGRIDIGAIGINNSLGSIVMGGGASGTSQPTGPAWGSYGINLDNTQINSGYGDIVLRGASNRTGSSEGMGVRLVNGATLMHGRNVSIEGWGAANSGPYDNNHGVHMSNAWIRTDSNINITGTGGGSGGTASGNNHGVLISDQSTLDSTWASGVGAITITGTGGGNSSASGNNNNDGIVVRDSGIWSRVGAVTLIGTAGVDTGIGSFTFPFSTNFSEGISLVSSASGSYSQVGIDSAQASSRQSGDITLRADSIAFDTSLGGEHKLLTSGTLTIEPLSATFASGLSLFNGDNLTLSSRLTGLQLGKPDNTADIAIWSPFNMNGLISVAGPIRLFGGNIDFSAALMATGASTILMQASQSINGAASVTAANLELRGGSVWLTDTGNSINTLAASNVGSLNFVNNSALNVGSVGSTSGISASGPVHISTRTGNLSIAQSIATTNASATALTLNANVLASRGSAAGGNLIFAGNPTLSVGSGGLAKLYTGSVAGSIGLTDKVGSGSGHFRYNSDEAAIGYDATNAALGSGLYAIYREQPAIGVTATATAIYGTLPTVIPSLSHTVNGDTDTLAISGLTLTVGATTSTSGNYVVGTHPITLSGGTSPLGYAIATYTPGTLSIGQKGLTTSGITATNKTYDGTTAATLSGANLVGVVGSDVVSLQGLTGTFSSRHVANSLSIAVVANLDGADSGNYTLSLPTGLRRDISPKTVTLSPQAVIRRYDGSTSYAATASDLVYLSGQLGVNGDFVTGAALSFSDKNVGTGKTLTAAAITLNDGNNGNNYQVIPGANNTSDITRLNAVTWAGGPSGNWFDPANWAGGAVPDLANVANVLIPSGITVNFYTLGAVTPANALLGVQIDGLSGPGGSLLQTNGQLTVGTGGIILGQLTQNGGTLNNAGTTSSSSFTQNGGSFNGTGTMVVNQFQQTQGLTSLQGDLSVIQAFSQGPSGSVIVGGQANIFHNTGNMQLGNLSVTSDLTINSSDGAIEQQPGTTLSIGGASMLTALQASAPASITLNNASNDFVGMVSIHGSTLSLHDFNDLTVDLDVSRNANLLAGGSISVSGTASGNLSTNASQISFGSLIVDGDLLSTTTGSGPQGGIAQTGPIQVRGDAQFTADTGTLQSASLSMNNNFEGLVSFTTNHGENWQHLTLNDISDLTLGDVQASGLLIAVADTNLTLNGNTSIASLDLTATSGDISEKGSSTLVVSTGQTRVQAGGVITLDPPNNGFNTNTSIGTTTAPAPAPGPNSDANIRRHGNSVIRNAVEKVQAMSPSKALPGTGASVTNASHSMVLSSNAQTAPSVPSVDSSFSSSGISGLTIDLRNTRVADAPIMVAVSLPKGTSTVGTGFNFAMPKLVNTIIQAQSSVQCTLPDGSALPVWLSFNKQTAQFLANAVPSGAFPLQITLTLDNQLVLVVISERGE